MKILHAPSEIAGQMSLLSMYLRRHGHKAVSLNFSPHKFGYKCDIDTKIYNISIYSPLYLIATIKRIYYFIKFINFDIFHFHYGRTLLPFNLDLPLLKLLKKKIIFHYHGSEIRNCKKEIKNYKWTCCNHIQTDYKRQLIIKKKARKYADRILISTPDLYRHSPPNSIYFPGATDINQSYVNSFSENSINIIHVPSNRDIKGTKYIISSIDKLKLKYNINFSLVENTTHTEAIKIMKDSDIVIDQLLSTGYGTVAIEAMSLGKIVVSSIQDSKLRETYYPGLPIFDANPDTLFDVIENVIKVRNEWPELSKQAKLYTSKFHSPEIVTKKLISIYNSLLNERH